jgi:hypothetical protein
VRGGVAGPDLRGQAPAPDRLAARQVPVAQSITLATAIMPLVMCFVI